MTLIKLENIAKIYGEGYFKTCALNNVNLSIEKGEFVAIMGPSGSGKSTLLNIIGCMDIPTTGEYYLSQQAVNNLNSTQLSKIRNKTISFIFQHFALMKEYSVYDNVELPLTMRKMSNRQKKDTVMNCLKRLSIEEYANKKPNQLSGGQQQRVAIGRALVSDAQIILADEPTGALDQKTGTEVMNILSEINKDGKTIIVVTHDNRVASYCNRKIIIEDGKIMDDSGTNKE